MIEKFFNNKYQPHLKSNERITVSLSTEEKEVRLNATLGDPNKHYQFEFMTQDGDQDLLVDYLDGVLEEFFSTNREVFLPLDFREKIFDDTRLWVKGEYRNIEAEKLAEKWLSCFDAPTGESNG